LDFLALEGMAPVAVLDLDHPEVRVAVGRAADMVVGLRLRDEGAVERRKIGDRKIGDSIPFSSPSARVPVNTSKMVYCPQFSHTVPNFHAAAVLQVIELREQRAAGRLAPADHGRRNALDATAAKVGADPKLGREALVGHGRSYRRSPT
jgi:hypothetical protein